MKDHFLVRNYMLSVEIWQDNMALKGIHFKCSMREHIFGTLSNIKNIWDDAYVYVMYLYKYLIYNIMGYGYEVRYMG